MKNGNKRGQENQGVRVLERESRGQNQGVRVLEMISDNKTDFLND